jgi:hypothetical protein
MSEKQAKEILSRWSRALRQVRETPSSSTTRPQKRGHFSFPVAGDENVNKRSNGNERARPRVKRGGRLVHDFRRRTSVRRRVKPSRCVAEISVTRDVASAQRQSVSSLAG